MSDWTETSVKSLARREPASFIDGDWIEAPYITNVGIRLIQTGNIGIGQFIDNNKKFISDDTFITLRCKEVLPGDVLICRLADPIGRACIVPDLGMRYITAVDVCILRVDEERYDKKFVVQCINQDEFLERCKEVSAGTTRQRISRSNLGNITLLMPPLAQQRKIAQILTTVDNLIEKTEALIAKYQAIKQGMMHDLFTRGVDANGHLRPTYDEAPELYKESELGWIPKEWRIGSITDFVDSNDSNAIKPGPFGSSLKKESYVEIGYKIYGQEQVIGGSVRIGDYYISQSKFNELYAFRIKPNDILMSLVGTVGKILIIPHDCEEGIINPRLIKISPDVEQTCPEFLADLLLSDIVKRQLSQLSHGLTMEVLSATTLKQVQFPIPLRDEQNRIASCIANLNNKVVREQELFEKYSLLKTGLMQDLLTGKVRVKVEKSGETAA